jgi:predicted phosphodiesterase
VDWGRSNVNENTFTRIETLKIDNTHYVQRATLTGLETETTYVYRVRSGTNATVTFTFRTAPRPDTPIAVAWWGDNHQGTVTLRTHIANMLAHGPDMICVAGDMVNSGNTIGEWHNYWFKPLEHLSCAQTRPVIFARGNHDGEHALAYAYSALPGNEAWFAFDYGPCRFIFLDSETDTSSTPEQIAWLQNELSRPETQRATFRIVCFHRPPWVNLWNGGGHTGETWVRNDWVPLFAQKNVDVVIGGHAHNYNRGASNGVTYVISGGGGGTLDIERVANWPLFTVEYSRYHFCLMEADQQALTWQAFDSNNQLIDLFTLQSRVPVVEWSNPHPGDGRLEFTLKGKPGARYLLQGSANLTSWTPLATNVIPATGPPVVTNTIAVDQAQRFLRAQAAP